MIDGGCVCLCLCVCVHPPVAAGASGSLSLWFQSLVLPVTTIKLAEVGYGDIGNLFSKVKHYPHLMLWSYFVVVTWDGKVTTMSLPQSVCMEVCVFVCRSRETSPW